MSRRDLDWGYLMGGLVPCLSACVLSLAVFAATAWVRADYGLRTATEGQRLAALEAQRSELGARLVARQRSAARFAGLEAAGIVGEEQRLQWAQVLRDGAAALQLPYLRYTAAPRQPFTAPFLVPGESAPVLVTPMDLQVGLVHELDLLRLLARLDAEAPGLVAVAGCTLERVAGDVPPEPDKANVTAGCELRWYSIQLPGAMVAMEDGA